MSACSTVLLSYSPMSPSAAATAGRGTFMTFGVRRGFTGYVDGKTSSDMTLPSESVSSMLRSISRTSFLISVLVNGKMPAHKMPNEAKRKNNVSRVHPHPPPAIAHPRTHRIPHIRGHPPAPYLECSATRA